MDIPWQAKIGGKILLTHVPYGRRLGRRAGYFRPGGMAEPDYAWRIFKHHFHHAPASRRQRGFVALELGPGDSLFSALLAYAHGATGVYLIDVEPLATDDISLYRDMLVYLAARGLACPELRRAASVNEILEQCGAQYDTGGLESLRRIPTASVDFIWSHATLEHVRREDFNETLKEMRRIIRPDGVCSHSVDLKDHLGGNLNNLRFPQGLWESEFVAGSGFYTNRIRCGEMLDLFQAAGFEADVPRIETWNQLPTPRPRLSHEFQGLPEEELLISGFDVVLTPGQSLPGSAYLVHGND